MWDTASTLPVKNVFAAIETALPLASFMTLAVASSKAYLGNMYAPLDIDAWTSGTHLDNMDWLESKLW